MINISKRLRLPTAKEIIQSKADLYFCDDEPWWVTNEEGIALKEPLSAGCGSVVPDASNSSEPNGIRLMLILPLKHKNDYAPGDSVTFGRIRSLPVEWVYIGNRRFISREVLDHYPFIMKILSYFHQKGSAAVLKTKMLAAEIFSKTELEKISNGTFEDCFLPLIHEGVLTIRSSVVEIPKTAFMANTHFKKMVIEERTTPLRIDDYAFAGTYCESVEGLEYCSYIGAGAFYQSKLSGTIRIGDKTIISDCAFEDNNITGIIFDGVVLSLGMSAFIWNKISDVRFSDKGCIFEIDEQAFSENNLSKETIDKIIDATVLQYASNAFDEQEIL